jgi:hypothetical protein
MAFQQDIYVAIRSGTPPPVGSGTWDDPYDGSTASRFDAVMAARTSGECVRLLPGTFPTTGHSGTMSGGGWSAPNGVRIVGSGMGVSIIQLTGLATGTRYVVGTDFAHTDLNLGFELSDVTIDCALGSAGTASSVGAIRVRGKHVFLRRIKVINYGTNSSGATITVITAAGDDSENCVIEECVIDPHPAVHVGKAIWYSFETSTSFHRFCAIRNCAGRGGLLTDTIEPPPDVSDKDYAAIAPGVGLGTIVEGNQFANVYYGIYASGQAAKDVVICNNYLRNVYRGVYWDQGSGATPVGRVIAFDNIAEISRAVSNPFGLQFTGSSGADRFTDLVLRRNIVRQVTDANHSVRTDMTGISVAQCTRLITENNVINDAGTSGNTRAVVFTNCTSRKFFNNQNDSGNLLRGYDTASATFIQELDDAVQDVLLPV